MRVFVFGPRVFGVRPGVSFGREDLRALATSATANRAILRRITLGLVFFCALAGRLIFTNVDTPDAGWLFGGAVAGAAVFYGFMRLLFPPH